MKSPSPFLVSVSLLHRARIHHSRNEKGTGAEMRPAIVSGMEGGGQLLANFFPSPVTVPSVFAKVHSAQVHSRFYSDEWKLGV